MLMSVSECEKVLVSLSEPNIYQEPGLIVLLSDKILVSGKWLQLLSGKL